MFAEVDPTVTPRLVLFIPETAAQLEFLADNSCDEIQGYFCSRPLPADQATELLCSRRRLLARPQLVSAAA